jgi:uncharacterized protein YlzI (FlbEa/FlbD family)
MGAAHPTRRLNTMIKLTTNTGQELWINASKIQYVIATVGIPGARSEVFLSNDTSFYVKDTPSQVAVLLENEWSKQLNQEVNQYV